MPKIKDVVNALTLDELLPEQPAPVPSPEADLDNLEIDAAVLGELVEKMTKPWQYGNCLSRFAKEAGVSMRVVRKLRKDLDRRIKAEQIKKAAEEE